MSNLYKKFAKNENGKDFVVGDIHGCFSKLQYELDLLNFNPEVDRLFSVGDLCDRGPESELAQEWLAKPWFHAVRGNHEEMLLDFAMGYLDAYSVVMNGGSWFIALTDPERLFFADLFGALPLVIEVETDECSVGILHAEPPFDDWIKVIDNTNLGRYEVKNTCIWGRDRIYHNDCTVIQGIDKIYVGHTVVQEPYSLGNVHYIDTGAVFGKPLTIVRIQ